ncbi:hypothetical protein F0U62_42685 [Cystobacter fuscus]|uniref:hypothetical protein n=1 Tax=Cystobacter fuscus TaxID=43 RepID=UPI002B2B2FEC|nr:hypothetical protein F0U62_42685 [Cystobacter fuscus]
MRNVLLRLGAALTVLFGCNKSIDFQDNPALLVEVSDDGIVSLDSYQGPVTGRLSGVRWRNEPEYLSKARKLIDIARRDKVAFAVDRRGALLLWYPTEDGAESLNQQLQKLESE